YGGGSGAIHVPAFDGGTLDIAVKLGGNGRKLEFSHAPNTKASEGHKPSPRWGEGGSRAERVNRVRGSDHPPPAISLRSMATSPTRGEVKKSRPSDTSPLVGEVVASRSEATGGGALKAGGDAFRDLPLTRFVRYANKPPSSQRGEGPIDSAAELLLALLLQQPKPPATTADQTNLDATITLRDVDIAKFIEQLEIKLPYKISGKATVQAKFGVPVDQVATRSSYRLKGTLNSPELKFEGLTIRDLKTELIYRDGKLSLANLSGKIP